MRFWLSGSFETLLDEVARRGSWVGGGSAAALSAALSAALLEKLVPAPSARAAARRIRRECLRLAQDDARRFAAVVDALRRGSRPGFTRALREATAVPLRVAELAQDIGRRARRTARAIAPRLRADLRCVAHLAQASTACAGVLINTNLVWLGDRAFAARVRRRLRRLA